MDTADVNLEFAHVSFRHRFDEEQVRTSARIASELISQYRTQRLTYAVCILIDDKHVRGRLTTTEVRPFLRFVSEQVNRIDYISFERRLPQYKDQMLDHIQPTKRKIVAGEMCRYLRRHRRIACSHDIAIWHLMRLGLVNKIDVGTVVPVGAISTSSPPFMAERIVSVLSEDDREAEERASREILQHCTDETVCSRIERIYF